MSGEQWEHREPRRQLGEEICKSRGPIGWLCCLPNGHGGNHIGLIVSYDKLSQWERDDVPLP